MSDSDFSPGCWKPEFVSLLSNSRTDCGSSLSLLSFNKHSMIVLHPPRIESLKVFAIVKTAMVAIFGFMSLLKAYKVSSADAYGFSNVVNLQNEHRSSSKDFFIVRVFKYCCKCRDRGSSNSSKHISSQSAVKVT